MNSSRFLPQALTLAAIALFLSSCAGARFDRDWKTAVAARETGKKSDPIAGPWQGSWLSKVNGHTGDLRCLAEPLETAACAKPDDGTTYRFRYHATWGKIMKGGFSADFPVVADGKGGYLIKGTKELGPFGGFDHDGKIRGSSFEANYTSDAGDHGVFEMKRP